MLSLAVSMILVKILSDETKLSLEERANIVNKFSNEVIKFEKEALQHKNEDDNKNENKKENK